MKLRIKLGSELNSVSVEATVQLTPLKVEAPNHFTLMAVIDAFIQNNPDKEVLFNCAKINRKINRKIIDEIDEIDVIPSKWTAQIYLIHPEFVENLFTRQNPRSFEVSFKQLKPIVYKEKRQPKHKEVKIPQEEVVVSNSATNLKTSLV